MYRPRRKAGKTSKAENGVGNMAAAAKPLTVILSERKRQPKWRLAKKMTAWHRQRNNESENGESV
jgi:hypothetical protein